MTRRRALQWASLGAILSLLTPVIVTWRADRLLPHYEGRSARAWFHRFHREHALDFEGRADEATRLECKTAFLDMPPEVLPFLVREALTPRRDSALRTNLHAIWKDMPPWAGRGMFAPESAAPDAARELIRSLRPPAPVLLPLLEPALAGKETGFEAFQATTLLGYAGAPSEAAAQRLIHLLDTYTSPFTRSSITNSLRQLAESSPTARSWILQSWTGADAALSIPRLVRLLGPGETNFVPRLEAVLAGTNDLARMRAAVALLKIVPDHQAALAELIRHLPTSNPQEARLRLDRSRSEAAAWLGEFVQGSGPLDSSPLRLVLEPLLREEIQQWSPRGTTHRFIHSMSRLAPDRTQALLREALATEAGPIAAGFLLNLDRGDAEATRILVHALESAPGTHIIAFTHLGNFASTNQAGMRFLHECLEHPETLANRNVTPRVNADYVRLLARQALARIRYREARLRHGLAEEMW